MHINEKCKTCLFRKSINDYPPAARPEQITAYRRGVGSIMERSESLSAPQIAEMVDDLHLRVFGAKKDFSEIKRHFNELMLSLVPHMRQQIFSAPDPLKQAVQYAMAGNYIDFAVLDHVDEMQLQEALDPAAETAVDENVLGDFRTEALEARRLVYFTDNCGEIVTDRLLVETLRNLNPALSVTVIVRGRPVLNDATIEDARQVRMEEAANRVLGNGTGMPGNVIGTISPEAMEEIDRADLLVAKGQGNFEGLSGCGLNLFYLFMCKCDLFTERFRVPRFTGIMMREAVVRM